MAALVRATSLVSVESLGDDPPEPGESPAFTVCAVTADGEERTFEVADPQQEVLGTVALAFGWKTTRREVRYGGDEVLEGDTFEDHGMEVAGMPWPAHFSPPSCHCRMG